MIFVEPFTYTPNSWPFFGNFTSESVVIIKNHVDIAKIGHRKRKN